MNAHPDADELLERLTRVRDRTCLTHVERISARAGDQVDWPDWVPDQLRAALAKHGAESAWRHQREAAEAAYTGRHVIISTGTASGKSFGYLVPVLSRLLAEPRATALYVSPTKALAADQLRTIREFDLTDILVNTYDGDATRDERDWTLAHARLVLTNPDMLHHSILPRHTQWSSFLRRLRYVVIDECHTYRGVFGSHVAGVVRRLRRVTARYQSAPFADTGPIFMLASATTGDPASTAARLTGLEVAAITDDGSPRAPVVFGLWEPPVLAGVAGRASVDSAPVRRSALMETADLVADLVAYGTRTLAFVRSRRGVEVVASATRQALAEVSPQLAGQVAAYRAGYLREDRRALERDLVDGTLTGMIATNALELGIDVAGLDAVILAGYPGTVASLWQQAGRAGRRARSALCVLVARDDPLDTYLVHHPESLFDRDIEATVLDPDNAYVLAGHLCCAAAELPLTQRDLDLFGGPAARRVIDALCANGSLRARPSGWYWTAGTRPDVDLRGAGGEPVKVVEATTGQLVGTVDWAAAHHTVHNGAIYLHQGTSYVVEKLDLDDAVALVRADEPDWSTHPRDVTTTRVVSIRSYVDAGPVGLFLGDVDVTSQVVSYQRRRLSTRHVIDTRPLDLPPRQLRTVAVWWTVSPTALADAGVDPVDAPGSLHAAEHASIGLLPLIATCDRWDVGGLSTVVHEDTGAPTVFVYDGHRGGAGFAERAYDRAPRWLRATRAAIAECPCESGCPSCIHSPKCGNGNDPLNKVGAIATLDVVLDALAAAERGKPVTVPRARSGR